MGLTERALRELMRILETGKFPSDDSAASDLYFVVREALENRRTLSDRTAERDQLRILYNTARDGMREVGELLETCRIELAESRAEVERLRADTGLGWNHRHAELLDATARAEAAEGRAAGLYRALCDTVRASGGVASDGISDTFLIIGVPAEMAARKKAQEAAESTVAGLRRALEEALQFSRDAAYGASIHAADSAICDSARRAEDVCIAALTASSDEHERRIKAEALKQAAEEVYNRLNAKGAHSGARRQGWEAGLVDFADYLKAEADRLEAANGNT